MAAVLCIGVMAAPEDVHRRLKGGLFTLQLNRFGIARVFAPRDR